MFELSPDLRLFLEALVSGGVIYKFVDLLKTAGLPSRFAPLVSFGLGIFLGLLFVTVLGGLDWKLGIGVGLGLGGITSTSYNAVKGLKDE
jgi:hypothetical protein